MNPKISLLAATLAAAFLVAACGKSSPPAATGTTVAGDAGPVVAKVNGTEIRQAQIGAVLAKIPNLPADKTKEVSKQVLEKLIEEELVIQLAKEKKLESDPKVVQALNMARNQILVQAYLEQSTANTPKPTDAEIKDFYDKNPALFKERKVYSLRELSIPARPDLAPKLQEAIGKAKSLEEVGAWLKSQNLGFNLSTATKPAEQLPTELVPRFAAMKDGQVTMVNAGNTLLVVQVMASRMQPADEAMAKPVIEKILTTQKRAEAASKDIKAQREKARVELLGEFAPPAPARPN